MYCGALIRLLGYAVWAGMHCPYTSWRPLFPWCGSFIFYFCMFHFYNIYLPSGHTIFKHYSALIQRLDVKWTLNRRCFNVMYLETEKIQRWFNVLNQRWIDIVSTLCACCIFFFITFFLCEKCRVLLWCYTKEIEFCLSALLCGNAEV